MCCVATVVVVVVVFKIVFSEQSKNSKITKLKKVLNHVISLKTALRCIGAKKGKL